MESHAGGKYEVGRMKAEKIREEINAKDKGDTKSVSADVEVCIRTTPPFGHPSLPRRGVWVGVPAVCIRAKAAGCPCITRVDARARPCCKALWKGVWYWQLSFFRGFARG